MYKTVSVVSWWQGEREKYLMALVDRDKDRE